MSNDDFVTGEGDDFDPHDPADSSRAEAIAKRLSHDETQALLARIRRRQEAYLRMFAGKPLGDDVDIVVADLTEFCRGKSTTFDTDARIHALLTGRQEVYLRIMDHLRLDYDTLVQRTTRRAT